MVLFVFYLVLLLDIVYGMLEEIDNRPILVDSLLDYYKIDGFGRSG